MDVIFEILEVDGKRGYTFVEFWQECSEGIYEVGRDVPELHGAQIGRVSGRGVRRRDINLQSKRFHLQT
jgi:hypothetical protein